MFCNSSHAYIIIDLLETQNLGIQLMLALSCLLEYQRPHLFQFYTRTNMRTLTHDCSVKSSIEMEPLLLVPCITQIRIKSW